MSAGTEPSAQPPVRHDLESWVRLLTEEFDVTPDAVDLQAVLDLGLETAHGVARPAVPLTGFFVGWAVASGTRDRAELDRVAARVTDLAREWATTRDAHAGESTEENA
ncbi:DUF6457 domain-containing protein [Actinotalea sp.]|uniref:DUF6457 domain-containing protein n=1 Tax=Actinotalea sp. TaxID=1872145 RepID=UPI003567F168